VVRLKLPAQPSWRGDGLAIHPKAIDVKLNSFLYQVARLFQR
jgi:hypothetical protein